MKSIWHSIRSAVTVILVTAFCTLIIWSVIINKLSAKDAIIALGSPVTAVITFYFAAKKRIEHETVIEK